MKKSVYSLVLMDDVVAAIDREAYAGNTSRSNLINQILAQHVSFVTPEMRMKDIFAYLEQILNEECYQIQETASDAMFAVRSPIRYKYKPTVRYSIELYRKPDELAGELRVAVRTSSRSFVEAIGDFFCGWIRMEDQYLGAIFPEGVPCQYEGGKYRRGFLELSGEAELSDEETANAIGQYIKVLDRCLKFYFENLEDPQVMVQIRGVYENYLASGVSLI